MLVVYTGRSTEGRWVQTADSEVHARPGVPVELPDATATSLLERRDWSTPKASKAGTPKE